jgi:hypothetical protein
MGKFGLTEIILILFVTGIMLIPQILYLLTLQKTIKAVSIENRKIQPGQVWLNIIPLFGLIWQFIVVNRIARSLDLEFKKRELPISDDLPGRSIGITYCILFCCSIVPLLGFFAALGGLVCWIVYWVKINDFKKMLEGHKI